MQSTIPPVLPPTPIYLNDSRITGNHQSVVSHLHATHTDSQYNQIRSLSLEVIKDDLAALRPGYEYQVEYPTTEEEIKQALKKGCFNLHFPITFEDGVKWLLRVRRDYNREDHPICPPAHYWPGVESEATTLQVMYEHGITTVSNAYLSPSRRSVTPGQSTCSQLGIQISC